jgi:hypothetical protein
MKAEVMMSGRSKKLLGTMIFVVLTTLYFLFAISVAMARLPGTSTAIQLLFYACATALWFFFAAVLIRWMQKPPSQHT